MLSIIYPNFNKNGVIIHTLWRANIEITKLYELIMLFGQRKIRMTYEMPLYYINVIVNEIKILI